MSDKITNIQWLSAIHITLIIKNILHFCFSFFLMITQSFETIIVKTLAFLYSLTAVAVNKQKHVYMYVYVYIIFFIYFQLIAYYMNVT